MITAPGGDSHELKYPKLEKHEKEMAKESNCIIVLLYFHLYLLQRIETPIKLMFQIHIILKIKFEMFFFFGQNCNVILQIVFTT